MNSKIADVAENEESQSSAPKILEELVRQAELAGAAFTIVFMQPSGLSFFSNRRREMWSGIKARCGFAETLIGRCRSRS